MLICLEYVFFPFQTFKSILDGIPAIKGLKFSMPQKIAKTASWGSTCRGMCQLGDRLEKFNPRTDNFSPIS